MNKIPDCVKEELYDWGFGRKRRNEVILSRSDKQHFNVFTREEYIDYLYDIYNCHIPREFINWDSYLEDKRLSGVIDIVECNDAIYIIEWV